MDLQLVARRALVTGGSRGIGLAVAAQLVAEGAHVVLAARDATRLGAAAERLREDRPGAVVVPVAVDTGDDESVRGLVDTTVGVLGGVDILVNAAAVPGGSAPPPKLPELTDDLFWDDVNVKVLGYLRCAREVAPHMAAQGWGRIVNVSGLAARQTGSIIGSIRNVAVAAATKNLADELGPSGINVTVVHPGLTRTEGVLERLAAVADRRGLSLEEVEAEMASTTSSRRVVDAEEVAWVVAFLASPRSVAINGDAIVVSGGARGSIHY